MRLWISLGFFLPMIIAVSLVASCAAPEPTVIADPAPPRRAFIIFFDHDKPGFRADMGQVISEMVAIIKSDNIRKIDLNGHTDRSGSETYNLKLSIRRAEAIKQTLIDMGISAEIIHVTGYGERQPLTPTTDGVPESSNRRVDVFLHSRLP